MAKSKYSASFVLAPSILVIHLLNGAQSSDATCFTLCPMIVILPLAKM